MRAGRFAQYSRAASASSAGAATWRAWTRTPAASAAAAHAAAPCNARRSAGTASLTATTAPRLRLHAPPQWALAHASFRAASTALAATPADASGNGSHLEAARIAYARAADLIDSSSGSAATMASAFDLLTSAAAAGLPVASGRLGRWYLYGLYGCPRDTRRALALLQAAARAGDATAQYWLGYAWWKMDSFLAQEAALRDAASSLADGAANATPSDSAADKGGAPAVPDPTVPETEAEAEARVVAAKGVIESIRKMRQANKIGKQLRRRAEAGLPSPPSAASPAPYEADDPAAVPLRSDTSRAHYWLLRAAEQDSADAQVALGNLYLHAEPRGQVQQAIAWYELAAQEQTETGQPPHPDALYNLGMIYYEGVPGEVSRDPPRAVEYFTRAADQLDTSALFWLGHAHRVGDDAAGIRTNGRKALRYLELAAGQGHAGAQHYLAQAYRNGDKVLGVATDEKRMK